jgi:hypothetical protein
MKDDKRAEEEPEDKQKKRDGQTEDKENGGEKVERVGRGVERGYRKWERKG